MADSLKIEIDVSAAKASLDQLSGAFSAFQTTAEKSTSGASTAVQRLNDAMKSLKGIDSGVLSSLSTLNQTISNLNTGAISTLNQALTALGNGSQTVQTAAQAVSSLGSALNAVKTPEGLKTISVNFNQAAKSAQDADSHVKAFYKNQEQLAKSSTKAAAAAQKQLTQETQRTQNAIKALGTELINASGFMQGLGVTAGKIISILADLAKANQTVGDVIDGLRTQFGNFGAAAAVVSGVATAFKLLENAVSALLQPFVSIGTAFQSFSNAIDAIDGKGAGAKALEQLTSVAKETAQDVTVLTKNYTGFRAATEAAGLTAGESVKIFRQFSGALTALGQSSEQTEKALLAITQMFSKGKVQAEELRGQLGDALPGAFQFAAKSINVSTAALDGMLKAGTVLATDLVPKLGEFLQLKFGDAIAKQAQTAIGQLKVFNTDIAVLGNAVSQGNLGGVLEGVANGLREINNALDSPALFEVAKAFGDLLGVLTNVALSTLGGIAQGFLAVFDSVARFGEALGRVLKPIEDVFDELSGGKGIMRGISDIATSLGKVIGVLGAYYLVTGGYAKALSIAQTGLSVVLKEGAAAAKALGINTDVMGKAFAAAGRLAAAARAELTFGEIKKDLAAASVAVTTFTSNLVSGVRNGTITIQTLGDAIAATGIKTKVAEAATKAWNAALIVGKGIIKGIAIFVIIEALTNLIPLLENATKKFIDWVGSIGEAKKTLEGFEPAQKAVTDSLQKFFETAAETPKTVFNLSNSFGTLSRAQQDAKGTLADLKDQLDGVKDAFKDSELASRESARATQEQTDGIKEQIDYVNREKAVQKERNDALRQAAQQSLENGKATKSLSEDTIRLTEANLKTKDSYAGYNKALRELKQNQKDVEFAAKERARNEQEYRDSLKESEQKLNDQIASIKEWGVALDDASQKVAKQLVALGETKKAAADYAYAFQQATKSNEELSDEIQRSIEQDKAKFDSLTKIRDAIEKHTKAVYDRVKASGAGTEAAEAATKADRERIVSLDGTRAALAQTAAADKIRNKIINEGKSYTEALTEASQEMQDEFGINIDQTKALNEALNRTNDALSNNTTKTDDAKTSSKTWGDTLKDVVSKLFSAGEGSGTTATNVQKVTDAFTNAQKVLDTASGSLTTISQSFGDAATNSSNLSGSLPNVSDALTDIASVIPDLANSLPSLTDPFGTLATDATTLATYMPSIQTSFEGISTAVQAGADTLKAFVDTLGRISGMADGIISTSQALTTFIDKIVSAQDSIDKAVKALGSLGEAGSKARDGFDVAIAGGEKLIDELTAIQSAVEDLVTAMDDLFKAAQKALIEASKAKAAQSNSGSGDSRGSGRYGGMAGNLPETQSVSSATFGDAPAFKDGTANTSSFLSKVPGGGIPSILHPNEAVVPLPKGRKIPVDLKIQQMPAPELSKSSDLDLKPLTAGLTDISKSLSNVADVLKQQPQAIPDVKQQIPSPQIIFEAPNKVPTSAQLNEPPQGRDSVRSSPDGLTPTLDSRASNNGSSKTVEKHITQPINITIQTQDADSFKRSKDQVAKQLSDSIKKANRRIGN